MLPWALDTKAMDAFAFEYFDGDAFPLDMPLLPWACTAYDEIVLRLIRIYPNGILPKTHQ